MGYARTVWITVGADGKLVWPEGELIAPKGFDGKVEGYLEGTVVEVHGTYERVDAHTKRLVIRTLEVAETPVERAFELWRRVAVFSRPDDDPKARPEYAQLEAAARAIQGEGSPKAMLLRAWLAWSRGELDDAWGMLGEALTLDTTDAELLVRTLWRLNPDASGLSMQQRAELVRCVWRNPTGWDWTHPLVAACWVRPERPLHFGGPRPDADDALLREWLARLAFEIATPEERREMERMRALSHTERRAWVSRLRAEDDERHDQAYTDMVKAWSANPKNDMDSPPDHVAVTWTEESRLLPTRWCGLLSGGDSWDDSLEAAPGWLLRFWRERGRDADALAHRIDAACILSALEPALVDRIAQVVFAHAGLTEGYACVMLDDGRACLLEATDGPFGDWSLRIEGPEALIDALPDEDGDLARVAWKRGEMAWSMRTHRIGAYVSPHVRATGPSKSAREIEPEKPRWVVHPKHGRGLVVGSIPGPKGPKLVIEFEMAGRKTLLHSFVREE